MNLLYSMLFPYAYYRPIEISSQKLQQALQEIHNYSLFIFQQGMPIEEDELTELIQDINLGGLCKIRRRYTAKKIQDNGLLINFKIVLATGGFKYVKAALFINPFGVFPCVKLCSRFRNLFDKKVALRELAYQTRFHGMSCTPRLYHVEATAKKVAAYQELATRGDLYSTLLDYTIPPATKGHLMQGVLRCVKTIHKKGVVHADLKPQNILLHTDYFFVMLTDFGLSCETSSRTLTRGTVVFIAPEALSMQPLSPKECDKWSAGLILLMIQKNLHTLPWSGMDLANPERMQLIHETVAKLHASANPVDRLIGRFLSLTPNQRPHLGKAILALQALDETHFNP